MEVTTIYHRFLKSCMVKKKKKEEIFTYQARSLIIYVTQRSMKICQIYFAYSSILITILQLPQFPPKWIGKQCNFQDPEKWQSCRGSLAVLLVEQNKTKTPIDKQRGSRSVRGHSIFYVNKILTFFDNLTIPGKQTQKIKRVS